MQENLHAHHYRHLGPQCSACLTCLLILTNDHQWSQFAYDNLKQTPFGTGVDIHLGRTGQEICPVSALLNYIVRRGQQPGPLFMFQDGQTLSGAHNEKERPTLNTAREPTFRQKST